MVCLQFKIFIRGFFFFFKLAPVWKAENYPEGGGRTQSHGEFQVEAQGLTEAEMRPGVGNQVSGWESKEERATDGELGKSEAESAWEMRGGDQNRGRVLTGSRPGTRDEAAAWTYGGAQPHYNPPSPQYPVNPTVPCARPRQLSSSPSPSLFPPSQEAPQGCWADLKQGSDMFELERSQNPCLWAGNELHPVQKLWAPPGITSAFTLPPPHTHTRTHITHHSLLSQGKFWYLVRTRGICRRYPVAGVACFWEPWEFAKMLPDNDGVPPHNPLAHWLLAAGEPVLCTLPCHPWALWLPWAFSFAGESHSAFQQA